MPKVRELREEYRRLLDDKRKFYCMYSTIKNEQKQIMVINKNIELVMERDISKNRDKYKDK